MKKNLYAYLFGQVDKAASVLEKAIAEPGDERAALRRAYEILVKAEETCEEMSISSDEE